MHSIVFSAWETVNVWCLSGNEEWAGMLQAIEKWKSNRKRFFPLQWGGGDGNICLCLTTSKPQLTWWWRGQQLLEQVCGLPLRLHGGVQILTACYCQGEVTLVVWYLLVNGCFRKQEDWDAEGVSAPFPHTHLKLMYLPIAWVFLKTKSSRTCKSLPALAELGCWSQNSGERNGVIEMCIKMKGARGADSVGWLGELMGVQKNVSKLSSVWFGSWLLDCLLWFLCLK